MAVFAQCPTIPENLKGDRVDSSALVTFRGKVHYLILQLLCSTEKGKFSWQTICLYHYHCVKFVPSET